MLQKLRASLKEKGQGIVEYALILAFVTVVSMALYQKDDNSLLMGQIKKAYSNITKQVVDFNSEFDVTSE